MALWNREKNQNTSSVPKRSKDVKGGKGVVSPSKDVELRMEQDQTRMGAGDRNIQIHDTINTDEKYAVLQRMQERMVRVENMLGQVMEERQAEVQERKDGNHRNADLTGKLREVESASNTLRNENKQLKERIAQLQREHKQTEETLKHRTGLENEVKRLQNELVAFQQQKNTQLDTLRNENKQLMAHVEREQKQTEDYRTHLEYHLKLARDSEDLTRQHAHLQRDAEMELGKTKEQLQVQKATSQQLENDNRELQIGLDNAQKHLLLQKRQLETAKWDAETERETAYKKSHGLAKELNQKQLPLEGRMELRGAQALLTTADQYTEAGVTRLVEHLNAEIMQVAAAMVDELDVEKIKNAVPLGDRSEVVMRVDRILGVVITKLLRKPGNHLLILVQTAFQTSMVSYTKRIVSSWSSDADVIEDILIKIYAQVRETELQPISARWKQLTKATLERMPDHKPALLPGLVAELGDILVAAGHAEGTERLKQRITDRFAGRLGTVLKLAQDLNEQVGQGFTSCDLELLYIAPDTAFNNTDMEDVLHPTRPNNRRKKEKIICTTDLGLERSERTKDGRKWSVLLKAKVILPSGLEEILGGPMH